MTVLATLLALGVSCLAIGYLATTDAKRRRVAGFPEWRKPRQIRLALALIFVPGLLLAYGGLWAGFVIWMAGATVVGWGIAAMPPMQAAQLGQSIIAGTKTGGGQLLVAASALKHSRTHIRTLAESYGRTRDRIDALEQKIAHLEAELTALRAGQSADSIRMGYVQPTGQPTGEAVEAAPRSEAN